MSQKTAKRKVPDLKIVTQINSGSLELNKSNIAIDRVYTPREVCNLLYGELKQPGAKITKLINKGFLKAQKIGRQYSISGLAIKDFIANMRSGGAL